MLGIEGKFLQCMRLPVDAHPLADCTRVCRTVLVTGGSETFENSARDAAAKSLLTHSASPEVPVCEYLRQRTASVAEAVEFRREIYFHTRYRLF